MGVTIGTYGSTTATGWTVITESASGSGEGSGYVGAGTRKIYVDSSAPNDSGDGSQASPKKTISGVSGGRSLLRDGSPDWLLLKKGGVWTDDSFNFLSVNGQDASNPILLGAYGSGARPLIRLTPVGSMSCGVGCITSGKGNFIAVIGIDFYGYTRDPGNVADYNAGHINSDALGSRWTVVFTFHLVEDCKFRFLSNGISHDLNAVGSYSGNYYCRRNVIDTCYVGNNQSYGMYIDTVPASVIEENVFDHNGWITAGAPDDTSRGRSRNLYIQYTCGRVNYRGNISARSSSEGVQFRPVAGSTVYDSSFVSNPIAFEIGHIYEPASGQGASHTDALVSYNVALEGVDISGVTTRGAGPVFSNCSTSGVQATDNIVANLSATPSFNSLTAHLDSTCTGIHVKNNIFYQWHWVTGTDLHDDGTGNVTTGNVVDGGSYPAPTRSVGSYNGTLGGTATLDAFLTEAKLQSQDNWRPTYTANALNNYIRAGFGLAALTEGGEPSEVLMPQACM